MEENERQEKINRGLNRIAFALMLERTEDIYQSVEAIRMGLLVLCIGGMAICIKRILTNG